MPDFEDLRLALRGVRVAHHIRGRVRLKLAELPDLQPLPADKSRAREVQKVLERVRGIRSLRVNALALSCTVEYDPEIIPAQAWADYVAGLDTAAARLLDDILHGAYQEIVNAELR